MPLPPVAIISGLNRAGYALAAIRLGKDEMHAVHADFAYRARWVLKTNGGVRILLIRWLLEAIKL
jgi:hypothetical protein